QQQQANVSVHDGKIGVAKKYYVTEKIVHYKKLPDRFVPVVVVVVIVVVHIAAAAAVVVVVVVVVVHIVDVVVVIVVVDIA
ncbi:unnamed protein product, partial [Rotaria sp. Silwood2]